MGGHYGALMAVVWNSGHNGRLHRIDFGLRSMAAKTKMAKSCALSAMVFVTAIRVASAQVGPVEDVPPPVCRETQPPAIVAAWNSSYVALTSAQDQSEAGAHRLVVGVPNRLTLVTRDSAKLPHAPGGAEQPKVYMYVGLASFSVPADGTYTLFTDEGMRIDVVVNGELIESSGFGRGVNCGGKHVDFPLKSGAALLQLVGAPYEKVKILIVPKP